MTPEQRPHAPCGVAGQYRRRRPRVSESPGLATGFRGFSATRKGSAMPRFAVEAPHQLGQEEAIARVKGLLERVKDRYQSQVSGLEESWADNVLSFRFTTYGFKIKGMLTAQPTIVKIDGELPFAAVMFKGRIEQTIRDELVKRLA
jgi:hypothetical protein